MYKMDGGSELVRAGGLSLKRLMFMFCLKRRIKKESCGVWSPHEDRGNVWNFRN